MTLTARRWWHFLSKYRCCRGPGAFPISSSMLWKRNSHDSSKSSRNTSSASAQMFSSANDNEACVWVSANAVRIKAVILFGSRWDYCAHKSLINKTIPVYRGTLWPLTLSNDRCISVRDAQWKFVFANFANDIEKFSQSAENFRILRRCEGIAEAQKWNCQRSHSLDAIRYTSQW